MKNYLKHIPIQRFNMLFHRMNISFPKENEVIIWVMPSFENCFVLKIDDTKITKQIIIESKITKNQIFEKEILREKNKNIEGIVLNNFCSKIILLVEEAKETHFGGLDGTSYYFITNIEGEIKIGEKWCPDPSSRIGILLLEIEKETGIDFF
ncbi:hypothetical protein [Bernardetia sp. MNP-M8]|uniref:hypothetical protein n=1 Tax=Bernardetia sp. MNP-M8 TaxID=3127470 RepID=UPI0030CD865F